MVGSLLLAASLPEWRKKFPVLRPRDFAIAIVFVLTLVFTANEVVRDTEYLDKAQYQSFLTAIRGAVSFKDWLPVWAHDFLEVNGMSGQVEAGTRNVTVAVWEPERRVFHVAAGQAGTARLRTYFYPHWVASEGGRPLTTSPAADGLLMVALPEHATDITVVFKEPPRVRLASLGSIVAVALIVLLAIFGWHRRPNVSPPSVQMV
jgi:hypothetical protein